MKTTNLTLILFTLAGLSLYAAAFQPGNLAILRAGDGDLNLKLKQSPAFIDEFATGGFNQQPLLTVPIPTNGPNTLFFNGHASTEGVLARSADHRLLTLAGYGGVNLLQTKGTPSLLDIGRGFCTVDAAGTVHTLIYREGSTGEKLNPRGGVTDGTNHFWGCGNAVGTIYYDPASSAGAVAFAAIPNTRAIRIVNNILYTTLNGPDGVAANMSPGIYSIEDDSSSGTLPRLPDSSLQLVVKARQPYTKISGFDINPEGTIAYTADMDAGIQKYVKTDGEWKFAYNFSIPQNIPAAENRATGCFGLVADFSGPAPVIYATTTEGYDGCINSNRVVRIVDTNATASVTTLAQAPSTRMVYRGIDFTPERP